MKKSYDKMVVFCKKMTTFTAVKQSSKGCKRQQQRFKNIEDYGNNDITTNISDDSDAGIWSRGVRHS